MKQMLFLRFDAAGFRVDSRHRVIRAGLAQKKVKIRK